MSTISLSQAIPNTHSTPPNVLSLLQRRQSGGRVDSNLNTYANNRLLQNIEESNSKPIEKIQNVPIKALDIHNSLMAVLRTDFTVQVLNDKGNPLWTHQLERNICSAEKIKIVGEIVICWDAAPSELSKYKKSIRMFHLYSGKKLSEIKSSRLTDQICILGEKRLFCSMSTGEIKEWDLRGKLVQTIKSENVSGKLLGLGNYLVHIVKNHINIHNVEQNKKPTKKRMVLQQKMKFYKPPSVLSEVSLVYDSKKHRKILKFSDSVKPLVTCACIDNDLRLLIGFQTNHAPDFCVIDLLNNGTIKEQFRADKDSPLFANTLHHKLKVEHIVKNKTGIYLSYSNGRIFSIKPPDTTLFESPGCIKTVLLIPIGRHKTQITELTLQGPILSSTSSSSRACLGALKLWDVSKPEIKKITDIQLPPCSFSHFNFSSKKIVIADQNSLVINDYLSAEKSPIPLRTMREACSIQ